MTTLSHRRRRAHIHDESTGWLYPREAHHHHHHHHHHHLSTRFDSECHKNVVGNLHTSGHELGME